MSTALTSTPNVAEAIEAALVHGDLKNLSVEGRVTFYNQVCQSLGLNPLTKPFAYIVLNGKLQLYALKDCTEQLRKIHGVSITSVDPKQIGDLLVVVASAKDREGKVDSSTGAVSIGQLKGEALANAMMKAETKAKRRVTLSICGLGMLDETEIQTLREQGAAHELAQQEARFPELSEPEPEPAASPESDQGVFSQVGDRLTCVIRGVQEKQTKEKTAYLTVTFNGYVEGANFANAFDKKLFPVLQENVGKETILHLRKGPKFLNIVGVGEEVDGLAVPHGGTGSD